MIEFVNLNHSNKHVFIDFCREFYSSDAVLHPIPDEHIISTANVVSDETPFARCLLFKSENEFAGYALLSFTYSNEAGGMVLLLEEIYVKDEYRGKGLGKAFFSWIYAEYDGKIKRYRLEVSKDNLRVCKLYNSLGFNDFDYLQMVRDL